MTAPIVIVGAGGFGREVLGIIQAVNALEPTWELLGYLDDGDPDEALLKRVGTRCIGRSDDLSQIDAHYVIGIGSGSARARIDQLGTSAGRSPATLVHPSAVVGPDVQLGAGAVVCAQASVTTHVQIGRHVHLNPGCTVGHDAVLEDFVSLFPGAAVSGNVHIGTGATLGARAVVLQGLAVGAWSMVGAGAVVTTPVPAETTVVGVPARSTRARPSDG